MAWLVDTVTYYVIHAIQDIWQDTRERKEHKAKVLEAGVVTCALHRLHVGSFQSPYKDCAGNGGLCVWIWDCKTSPKKQGAGQVL